MTTPPVLILDNGAHSIKAGISGVDQDPRSTRPAPRLPHLEAEELIISQIHPQLHSEVA